MAKTFNLPAVGDTMVEGEIVEWFVAVGDVVDLDQLICSVATDKSVVEMSTPHRGTVLALGGQVGDTIDVGSPLLTVGEPGEVVPQHAAPDEATAAIAPQPEPVIATSDSSAGRVLSPVVRRLASDHAVDVEALSGTGPGGRVTREDVDREIARQATSGGTRRSGSRTLAMPKVRRRARELAVDLSTVAGSGPGGAVTMGDIDGSSNGRASERRERMSPMRRAIAAHLVQSVREIPQFTSMIDVDASALLATRAALREGVESLPIDALLMKLMIPVLVDHPLMTAWLDGDDIVYFDRFDIGVAVDTPDGLMVPVVRNADAHNVAELGAEITRLADAARSRSIHPDELTGATCTLNNVGSLGVLAGTPILPVGTSTIVAFGKARPLVELRDGSPVAVPTMTISATFDHRIIDGGHSGRFLAQLKRHLEVPALGLL